MAKNTKNNGNNSGKTTRPYFVIAIVEGDIRRGKSTTELCEKFNKTPEDIANLISRAYHGSENKVREINRTLQSNDERYQQKMASKQRREAEVAASTQVTTQPEVTVITEAKTPVELQEEQVRKAESELKEATQLMNAAEEELKAANATKVAAQENLRKAKEALNKADDAEMKAESKKFTAEEKLKACRKNYDLQTAKLGEMVKPKLLHISAVEQGIPGGKVYMSEHDYAKLSDADKAKVIPVNTDDITFAAYPDDFFLYPAKMGMERYMSAYQYALAYVKLILESDDGKDLELHCLDEEIKYLAQIQQG